MNDWGKVVAAIAVLPEDLPERIAAIEGIKNIAQEFERKSQVLAKVHESLSQLRLDLKYLIFDLEATRRERDNLREKLDE